MPTIPAPDLDAVAATLRAAIIPSTKVDGWTGERQRRFLEAIADGDTVRDACSLVRLSAASAYAFRRRAKGRAFDLGWRAADLLARERVAADLLVRAVEGQVVEITRPDGSVVTRHHYDNRIAVQMLARLDRYADAADRTAPGHAARVVAGDFDAYLDVVGSEGGPARAGLFMLARDGEGQAAAELEPVIALARADRHLRCGTLAADVAVADLDPAQRSGWSADQWARAEVAGLVALAPPPAAAPAAAPAPGPHAPEQAFTCQPVSTWRYLEPEERPEPVWWDELSDEWRTRFPPGADFLGEEDGEYGAPGYSRQLDDAETSLVEGNDPAGYEDRLARDSAERDRWFAACAAGTPHDDRASHDAADRPASAGSASSADTADRKPAGHDTPPGAAPTGNPPASAAPDGAMPEGAITDGAMPDGAITDEAVPDGATPNRDTAGEPVIPASSAIPLPPEHPGPRPDDDRWRIR